MTEKELVEALARRLTALFVGSLLEHEGSQSSGPEEFPSLALYDMTAVARECLRQMEWARRKCDGYETGEVYRDPAMPAVPQRRAVGRVPLTLAPEDWKP